MGTDGGPSSGSVDNALTQLSERGLVVRVSHAAWARAAQPGHSWPLLPRQAQERASSRGQPRPLTPSSRTPPLSGSGSRLL